MDIGLSVAVDAKALTPPLMVRALVDTGADFTYANPSLLSRMGATPFGDVGNVNGGEGAKLWGLWLRPVPDIAIPVIAIDRDFTAQGSPYDFVLGRFALQHFRLSMALATPGACHLEFLTEVPKGVISVESIIKAQGQPFNAT